MIENIRPERLDKSVTLYGLDYIDVPAMTKREYKINFYSYKEGSFLFKVKRVLNNYSEFIMNYYDYCIRI